jgi:hypothetical protein
MGCVTERGWGIACFDPLAGAQRVKSLWVSVAKGCIASRSKPGQRPFKARSNAAAVLQRAARLRTSRALRWGGRGQSASGPNPGPDMVGGGLRGRGALGVEGLRPACGGMGWGGMGGGPWRAFLARRAPGERADARTTAASRKTRHPPRRGPTPEASRPPPPPHLGVQLLALLVALHAPQHRPHVV